MENNQPQNQTPQDPSTQERTPERNDNDHSRNEEKLLLEWVAPSRPYKKRDREFYTTIAIIVFLVSLILFFAGQFLFIAVVVSVAFVAYVINTVPPENVHNSVSTFGIRTGDNLFYWEELGRFWFTESHGTKLLNIETARAFPGVLILLLEGVDQETVKKTLLKYTVFEKPKDTWLDNSAKWLQEKFPLDKQS